MAKLVYGNTVVFNRARLLLCIVVFLSRYKPQVWGGTIHIQQLASFYRATVVSTSAGEGVTTTVGCLALQLLTVMY